MGKGAVLALDLYPILKCECTGTCTRKDICFSVKLRLPFTKHFLLSSNGGKRQNSIGCYGGC